MLEQDRRVLVYKFGASSRIYMMLCTGHPLAMPLHGHFSDSSRNQLKGLSYISASHMGTRATNEDLAVSSSMLNLAVDGVSRKVFCIPSGQNLASLHGRVHPVRVAVLYTARPTPRIHNRIVASANHHTMSREGRTAGRAGEGAPTPPAAARSSSAERPARSCGPKARRP